MEHMNIVFVCLFLDKRYDVGFLYKLNLVATFLNFDYQVCYRLSEILIAFTEFPEINSKY